MTPRILFIHRSCGKRLLKQGRVRELLPKHELQFSDYDNNAHLLTDADGRSRPYTVLLTGDNTTPDAYATFFSDYNQHDPQLQNILRDYDTVVIKSCYPVNAIKSDAELEEVRDQYTAIMQFFRARPALCLGIVTTPPLAPKKTDSQEAARARQLATWLETSDFGQNIRVFDFYNRLSNSQHMLKKEFRSTWSRIGFPDSHPNSHANQNIGPDFTDWLQGLPKPALYN